MQPHAAGSRTARPRTGFKDVRRAARFACIAAVLGPASAGAEQIECPSAGPRWTLAQDAAGPPPGTIEARDGAARATCTYRHVASPAAATATYVWLPRGALPSSDPLLRCDRAVFARLRPGDNFSAELGAHVYPGTNELGYVAVSPAPAVARDDAQAWNAMRWTAQIAYLAVVEARAVGCDRAPRPRRDGG
ncbi:MAG: hypothetical protein JNL66_07805 [Alphaproteobacteria bacterium]|nr:hypothetical protein [Alphaproteobacteria bacterium]